jgi:hypothetical protein
VRRGWGFSCVLFDVLYRAGGVCNIGFGNLPSIGEIGTPDYRTGSFASNWTDAGDCGGFEQLLSSAASQRF